MQGVVNRIEAEAMGRFRRAATVETFVQDSLHQYFEGHNWSVIHVSPNVWVLSAWDCLSEASALRLTEICESILAKSRPYISLFDVRLVSSIDPAAFRILGDFLVRNSCALNQFNLRHAVLRPQGVMGAVAAGFYAVHPAPRQREAAVFETWSRAVDWLTAGPTTGLPTSDNWQLCLRLCERPATGETEWLALVQELLRRELPHCNLQRAARPLGLSTRSLQRRLAQVGTTFQAQIGIARIGAAQERLRRGEGPMTRVALDVGFTCSQNFSRQFRKVTGVTPTQWRRQLLSGPQTARAF